MGQKRTRAGTSEQLLIEVLPSQLPATAPSGGWEVAATSDVPACDEMSAQSPSSPRGEQALRNRPLSTSPESQEVTSSPEKTIPRSAPIYIKPQMRHTITKHNKKTRIISDPG